MATNDPPRGHRERKKQLTRSALSWATIRLSVERGWANVTIDDVAAEVGVTGRTFRNYYGSLGEAVMARHLDRMVGIAEALRAQPTDEDLDQAICNAVRSQWQADEVSRSAPRPETTEWAAGVRLMVSEPEVLGEMLKANAQGAAALTNAIADRLGTDPTTDYYPALVASVTNAAISVALDHWLQHSDSNSVESLIVEVLHRLWSGLPVH